MSKTFDEMMKLLEEKGGIAEEEGAKLIKEHGPLTDDEKKDLAAAIRMRKALTKPAEAPKPAEGEKKDGTTEADKKDEKPAEGEKKDDKPAGDAKPSEEKKDEASEATMDDYLQALSVLDSDDASKEDKEKAEKVKEKFESQ